MKTKPEIRYEDSAEQRTVTGWVCKTCGRFWGDSEHMASWCCATSLPCEQCDKRRTNKHYTVCDDCRRRKEAEKEAALFAKATHDTNYDGMVFFGDDYHMSVEDFMERHWDDRCDSDDLPQYVWCCKGQLLSSPELADIIGESDDWPDPDYGEPDLDGLDAIQKALDAWCASKGVVSYVPDYKRYVLLDWSGFEKTEKPE